MDANSRRISIESIPAVSAIYFALLQCGYEYYEMGKPAGLADKIKSFVAPQFSVPFFGKVKQSTCEAYPYWPRAAMLETAVPFLDLKQISFCDFDVLRKQIMTSGNISREEKDVDFWEWIKDFPFSLNQVMQSGEFQSYIRWEKGWIDRQNRIFAEELDEIKVCVDLCTELYLPSVSRIHIVLNPIKCAYSADYYVDGDCFICCSGTFRKEAVIHEFFHPVVHGVVADYKDDILQYNSEYPGIDGSYFLSCDEAGRLNAFEEYAVRMLTDAVISGNPPESLEGFTEELLRSLINKSQRI